MKRLIYIFIPILAILLMSHNANAIMLNIPVENTDTILVPYWRYQDASIGWSDYSISGVTRGTSSANINRIQLKDNTNSNLAYNIGDYYEIMFFVETDYLTSDNTVLPESALGYFDATQNVSDCNVVGFDFSGQPVAYGSNAANLEGRIRYEGNIVCKMTKSGVNPTVNLNLKSNTISGSFITPAPSLTFQIKSISVYKPTGNINDEQAEATQEASDESQDAGDSSSSDAEGASSSLISAIGGFVTAVTSASPSNCNINGDMGNMDLGTVDLCANPVPTFVQIISSLVLIAICIPFAIIMFNRFIGMFRSFQG